MSRAMHSPQTAQQESSFITTDYGVAAYCQLVEGCLVEIRVVARGRAEFTVHLREGSGGEGAVKTNYLNSAFSQFDELVRRFRKMTY